MIASAYAYADGGAAPTEIKLSRLIERYGVEAVMGRPYLGYGEILRMQAAETIVRLHQKRLQYEDWALFARDHRDESALLNQAMIAASKMGLIDG